MDGGIPEASAIGSRSGRPDDQRRTDGHNLPEDKKIVETFEHWKGFGKHCEEHSESENIDKLLGFNVPIDTVKELYKLGDIYN